MSEAAPTAAAPARSPVVGPRSALALAVASGVFYFVSFPGIGAWPLGFVALAPLVVAIEGREPRSAALLGLTTGFVLNVGGFYWLYAMLQEFAGFPAAACALLAVVLWVYQGGRLAVLAWLHASATARGWPRTPVFLGAFATSELLYPLLFPWYFGATTLGAPAFAQVAELGGPYAVSLVLVLPSLVMAEWVIASRRGTRAPRRLVIAAALVTIAAGALGALRMRQIDAAAAAAPAARVGLAQSNMPLLHTIGARVDPLAPHLELTRQLRSRGVDLVVWPEAALTRAQPEGAYREAIERVVGKDLRVPTIVGTILYRRDPDPARSGSDVVTTFNSAILVDAAGKATSRYDKQYLMAFGEFIPFGETFPILYQWSPNSGRMSAGASIEPLVVGDHRITTLICYEDILPAFVNAAVRHARPDLLVNMANDTWFGNSTEPWEHLALAQLRSIEHRRYLVRTSNSGVSGVVDANGRLTAHGGVFRREAIDGEVRWMSIGPTVYEVVGDVPWWIVALATVAAALQRPGKRRSPLHRSAPRPV